MTVLLGTLSILAALLYFVMFFTRESPRELPSVSVSFRVAVAITLAALGFAAFAFPKSDVPLMVFETLCLIFLSAGIVYQWRVK